MFPLGTGRARLLPNGNIDEPSLLENILGDGYESRIECNQVGEAMNDARIQNDNSEKHNHSRSSCGSCKK